MSFSTSQDDLLRSDPKAKYSFATSPGRRLSERQFRAFPPLPVMPDPLLKVQSLLECPPVNLQAVTSIVRGDLGLTLQVLRIVACDRDGHGEDLSRIQNCIVYLGMAALQNMVYAVPVLASSPSPAARLWQHSRLTAVIAESIASGMGDIDPEKAYLSGLLHDIGTLPELFSEYRPASDSGNSVTLGCELAAAWDLPAFVAETITGLCTATGNGRTLADVVAAAHARVMAAANQK